MTQLLFLLLAATCPNATPLDANMRWVIEHHATPSGTAKHHMVVTSHPLATKAALDILAMGGTAADAFIAAVLVQDVVFPGVTSTAGLAGVAVYDAKTKRVTIVHGGFAEALDVERRYRDDDTALGKRIFVPGAPAAYAVLSKTFGKLPFAVLVEPAADVAENGFTVDELYALVVSSGASLLKRTPYGYRTYFTDGRPVALGETLRLPAVAETLRAFGADPSWFYHAPWAAEAVTIANANGGDLVVRDFETYAPDVGVPTHGRFMGNDLYAAGEGGVKLLTLLGTLERIRGGTADPPVYESAATIDRMLLSYWATTSAPVMSDRDALTAKADADVPSVIDGIVRAGTASNASAHEAGTHSSAAVVIDDAGNMVVGTHTSESEPWSSGYFVGGVLLAAPVPYGGAHTSTKTRIRIDPTSNTIVVRDGKLRAGLAVYGTGLAPADAQVLDNLLALNMSPRAAVDVPRVGPYDKDIKGHVVDPRFPDEVLCASTLPLKRSVDQDTGYPTLIAIDKGGISGVAPDSTFLRGTAQGE